MKKMSLPLVGLLLLIGAVTPAQAEVFPFVVIPDDESNPVNAAIGEAQLTLEVLPTNGDVLFTFANAGPEDSVIRMVAFEQGGLLDSVVSLIEPAGVSFSVDASPGNLPRGNSLSPPFDEYVTATADPPPPANGVGPNESLGVVFSLLAGATYDDVIAALNGGALRVGVHVIGFADGGSESFYVIPAPASVVLGMIGLSATGWWRRKRMTT